MASIAILPAHTPLSIPSLLFISLLCLTVCPQLYTAGRRAVDIVSANPSRTVSRDGNLDSKLLPFYNGQVRVSLNTTELLKELKDASCGAMKVNGPAASAESAAAGHGAGSWLWKNWKGQGSEGSACSSSWEKDGCQDTVAAALRERAHSCIHWVEVPNSASQYKLLVCAEECSNSKPQTRQGSTGWRSLDRRVGCVIIILILLL